MGLFVLDAELMKKVEDHVGFDLQLASQLVDADFTHIVRFSGRDPFGLLRQAPPEWALGFSL